MEVEARSTIALVPGSGLNIGSGGLEQFYASKSEELDIRLREKKLLLQRLEAQRSALNKKVREWFES